MSDKQLTKEQLLKLRYLVIADYPHAIWKVGDILHNAEFDPIFYPHIFQPLQWWNKREVLELPDFVKINAKVYRCIKWGIDNVCPWFEYIDGNGVDFVHLAHKNSQPATEQEYEAYLKTTQP